MKLLLVGVLVIAVTNALPTMDAEDESAVTSKLADEPTKTERVCEPGVTRRVDCNICMCNKYGTAEGCTKKLCLLEGGFMVTVDPEKICEPDSTRMIECNTCRCGKNGRQEACTQMPCDSGDVSKFKLYCVPGEDFQTDEANCHCDDDGRSALCSLKNM